MKDRNKKYLKKPAKANEHTQLPRFAEGSGMLFQLGQRKFIIKNPHPSLHLDLDDISHLLGERGLERVARKKGQSGIKLYTNHTLFIKDLRGKERIGCKQVSSELVTINGKDQPVPAYQPITLTKK